MPTLSEFERIKAIGMLQAGVKAVVVARSMGVHKSTITRLKVKLASLGERRAVKNQPRGGGRPPKIMLGDVKLLLKLCRKFPRDSCTTLKMKARGKLDHLSVRRLQEMLLKAGFPSRRAAKKPLLTPLMKNKRLLWCISRMDWTPERWEEVLWSDESTFRLIRGTCQRVRRPFGSDRSVNF